MNRRSLLKAILASPGFALVPVEPSAVWTHVKCGPRERSSAESYYPHVIDFTPPPGFRFWSSSLIRSDGSVHVWKADGWVEVIPPRVRAG